MKLTSTKLALLVLVAALLSPLIGQEAKIIIVEKSDSQRLKRAYEKYKDAQAEWSAVKAEVAKSYTNDKGKTMDGWEKIQFSADFRAMVPDSSQYAYRPPCGCSGITFTNSLPVSGLTTLATGIAPDADLAVNQDLTVKAK